MQKNFNEIKSVFIIISKDRNLKYVDIKNYTNTKLLLEHKIENELLRYVKKCDRIFIHYLRNDECEFICKNKIKAKIYWALWGSDYYQYITKDLLQPYTKRIVKNLKLNRKVISIKEQYKKYKYIMYRKKAIQRIDYILCAHPAEYHIITRYFKTNARFVPFLYPTPVNQQIVEMSTQLETKIKHNIKQDFKILVGNSGNPTNNHADIFEKLYRHRHENIKIIVPLSYGDEKYIKHIIKLGKKLFGKKFVPLTQFLDPHQYANTLSQIDIAIMNHNRQQAIGNIITLLYLKKKIFINHSLTTHTFLEDIGIKTYDCNTIQNLTFEQMLSIDNSILDNNKNVAEQFFSDYTSKKYMRKIITS